MNIHISYVCILRPFGKPLDTPKHEYPIEVSLGNILILRENFNLCPPKNKVSLRPCVEDGKEVNKWLKKALDQNEEQH